MKRLSRNVRLAAGAIAMLVAMATTGPISAQVINLNSVIGPGGTNASTVDGPGNAVNFSSNVNLAGTTTLTSPGSSSSPTFNFNGPGFPDLLDRAHALAGPAGAVFADRKFNSVVTSPIILDTDNDTLFTDETDSAPADPNTLHFGFGMHGDNFITFDLNRIRADNGLALNTPFLLTGEMGIADIHPHAFGGSRDSAVILLDGQLLQLADFSDVFSAGVHTSYDQFELIASLEIPGSAQFLTFAGIAGLDGTHSATHVAFKDVQLTVTPEPTSVAMWLLLAAAGGSYCYAKHRRARRNG